MVSADPVPFALGVASGDPAHDSVVLWTHVPGPATVHWEVAEDEEFRRVVRQGEVISEPSAVHVTVGGLAPDRWYHYRFTTGGVTSRVGRTRTLPAPGADTRHLRFAFASCQAWAGGPYPAYRDMVRQDLDFVIHLGDYVYETADGSLAEYRRLHALYKSSPDLRDAHARFPFFTTWDDHELFDNWAGDHVPSPDGRPVAERRANAFRAYYEHLPMRTAPVGGDWPIFRRFTWGRLAEFAVLDTRQYRDAPGDDVSDPARTMTGPEQETWLLEGLRRSRARWNVIAQQTILARFDYDLGPGRVYNLDQWDGYPAARQRILDTIVRYRPRNPVILAGDWHSHWVNDILADFDDPASPVIASEFAGTSISSGIGWDADVRQGLPANPHVKLYNGSYRGYVVCDVTRESWQTTLRVVVGQDAHTLAVFEVRDGTPGARQATGGDSISGRVSTTDGPLANAEVVVAGTRVWTDATGAYLTFVPSGTHTLEAHATGYEPASRTVTPGRQEDIVLTRVTGPYAGRGRRVPGPYAEAGPTDVVLGNGFMAMAVADGFEDPQLPGATRGKPVDLAAVGRLDQLDWLHLPYAATTRPVGTEAWQQGLLITSTVEVAGTSVVVRASGSGLDVVTTYSVTAADPWITATSVFTNPGPTATWWLGDAMDHDGPGQRGGVAGHGTITAPYESPATYLPTGRWIGMTGSDAQTYGLVYEQEGFTAYGNGNWIQSQHEVTIEAGGTWTLTRRITALPTTTADPWTPLDTL